MDSFSIHSTVLGEESTFEYPHPDPELNKPILEETSLNGESNASANSIVSEGFEDRMAMIHEDYRMVYIRMVGELTFKTRINLYKILESLHYTSHICGYLLDLFEHVGAHRKELIINTVITFYVTRRVLFMDIVMRLKEPQLDEMLSQIPLTMTQNFVELCFYLSPDGDRNSKQWHKEFELFIELTTELSLTDINAIMGYADESFAKHCRLCRQKRLYALEYRMQQGQVKPEHASTPGMLGSYEDGTDNWRANGEHFFTFDYDACLVFWRGKEVDLVKICDTCLNDTHGAISEVNRFQPVHHLEGFDKKDACTELRKEEATRAHLFKQLSVKRLHRHAKDWSVRALKTLREGHIREAKERQAATDKILQARAEEARRAERASMFKAAKRVDKPWMKHEKATQAARNAIRDTNADLKYRHPYARIDKSGGGGEGGVMCVSVPTTREHPHSWRLAGFDSGDGGGLPLPMSREAASERFGTGKVEPDVRTPELTLWKQQAAYLHRNHLDKVAAEEREKAAARTAECRAINRNIEELDYLRGRAAKLKRLKEEQEEEDRLEARAEDRVQRRLRRLRLAEEAEREAMGKEDTRSWEHRYYLKECAIIARELSNMARQERAQRCIDDFWGIPTDIINRKNRKDDVDAAWRAKVASLRALGMQTAVWVPFQAEVELGSFRHKDTGLPIKPAKHTRVFEHYKERGPNSNQHTSFNHTYQYEDLESKRTGTAGSRKRI